MTLKFILDFAIINYNRKGMKCIVLFFFLFQSAFILVGQNSLSDKIIETSIKSTILNEEREILIFSSLNNESGVNSLPTIYLLDGKENFLLTAGIILNLIRAELIPNVNLVGINNNDYDREYNLTTINNSEDFKTGGFLDFQEFIVSELLPFAASNISTSKYKIFIGHSLGGFFGLKMLVKSPNAFSSAIFIDPSIWWNKAELLDSLKIDKNIFRDVPIYLSRSAKNEEDTNLFNLLESTLESSQVKLERFPNENHISTIVPSIFNGLKYLFRDFSLLESLYKEANFSSIKEKIEKLGEYYNTTIPPKVRVIAPMARVLTNKGEYAESVKILKYLEEYHPEDIMVLNFLGEAYEKSGDLRNARLVYNKSLNIAKSKNSPMVGWIEKRLSAIEN